MKPIRFLIATAVFTASLIVASFFLPHSRHLRFAALKDHAVLKAGWIYERIHFDPTPTDVVFLGTSHTVFGIDSATVERQFRAIAGRDTHVVNFALQHLGRDIHFLIAREILGTRPVKLLVIEVQEDEPRDLHPAFGALADPGDLLSAPLLVNVRYFENMAHLPLRRMRLFLSSLAVGSFGPDAGFDAMAYEGAHWNDTYRASIPPPIDPPPRTRSFPVEVLETQRRKAERRDAEKLRLPPPLQEFETRANRLYIRQIVAAAKAAGTPIAFLYLPSFGTEAPPRWHGFFDENGVIWHPPETLAQTNWWLDVGHLNYYGAQGLSEWIGSRLAGPATEPDSRKAQWAQ
jgi:hypothetical protein